MRWLALLEVVIGLAGVIVIAAISQAGVAMAAVLLAGIKWVTFISLLLYSLSYISPKVTRMKTVFSIPVQRLLRYAIIGILVLGLAELILNSIAATNTAGFIVSVFTGMLSSITFTVIFYAVHLQIQVKKSPEAKEIKAPSTKSKSPTSRNDWVDSLLKDVDRPDNPID